MKQALTSTLLLSCLFIAAHSLDNGLGLKPQMGWNSWNKFGCNINETVVKETAAELVSSGLLDAGYEYLNIDDCWQISRDDHGVIVEDGTRFPSGMGYLTSYVHSKGLKFGLYSDAGTETCQGRPGGLGHEQTDADTYAKWGIDYLKYDNCNNQGLPPQPRYQTMRDALNATGAPIFFSMCEWGDDYPWKWAPKVGNSWRTTGDIQDNFDSMLRCLDNSIGLAKYAGPGGWNDPDMLEVGNGGMSTAEYQAHFGLWAAMKAPLLIGCDIRDMTDDIKSILLNKEVIAINQDDLGVAADLVYQEGPSQVWAGPLSDGSRVVVLFNRERDGPITADFTAIGFKSGTSATVRDLFAKKDVGTFTDSYTATVDGHAVQMIKVTPTKPEHRDILWRPWHTTVSDSTNVRIQ